MMTLEPPRRLMVGEDPWAVWGLSRVGLRRFVARAQAAVGLAGEVDVLLTGDRVLRRLNREFRGKDKATDVLSFPAPAKFAVHGHAGDLAVSLETAQRQARDFGHALQDEVKVLLLHGLLHLAGMDHEVDAGEMAAREADLRRVLRLKVGLIGRAEAVGTAASPASLRNDKRRSESNGKDRSGSSAARRMTPPLRRMTAPLRSMTAPPRSVATPSRSVATPLRSVATPSRGVATPSRSVATPLQSMTSLKRIAGPSGVRV